MEVLVRSVSLALLLFMNFVDTHTLVQLTSRFIKCGMICYLLTVADVSLIERQDAANPYKQRGAWKHRNETIDDALVSLYNFSSRFFRAHT